MKCSFPLTIALVIILGVSSTTTTLADHLPGAKLARGKEEVVLAGVQVYKTPITKIVQKLGKPSEERELSAETRDAVGERLYVWKKKSVTVQVQTMFSDKPTFKSGLRETPSYVTVDGTDGELGRTGRGLRLGDPYRTIAQVYGNRYVRKGRHITIQWETTTTLKVAWNERGVINHIELLGPE